MVKLDLEKLKKLTPEKRIKLLKEIEDERKKELEKLQKKIEKEKKTTEQLIQESIEDLTEEEVKKLEEKEKLKKNIEELAEREYKEKVEKKKSFWEDENPEKLYDHFIEPINQAIREKDFYGLANKKFYGGIIKLKEKSKKGELSDAEKRTVDTMKTSFQKINMDQFYITDQNKKNYVSKTIEIIDNISKYNKL